MQLYSWLRPHPLDTRFRLSDGKNRVIADAAFLGAAGLPEAAGGASRNLSFVHSGSLKPRVVVHAGEAPAAVLQLTGSWRGEFVVDGLRWKRLSHWRAEFVWEDADQRQKIVYRPRSAWWRDEADITVGDPALPRLTLLLLLGAFLRNMVINETAVRMDARVAPPSAQPA